MFCYKQNLFLYLEEVLFMVKALDGILVLDMSRVLSAPFTGMVLADMGADVIKIEALGHGDDARAYPPYMEDESIYFMDLNRGKRSITLNLKSMEGKEILKKLVKKADVLVENFRGGTMEKLGLDYTVLKEINPKLIYTQITGFGRTGPRAKAPAYDVIVQGMGGIMSLTGEEGGTPMKVGISQGDIVAGLYGAIGTAMALIAREKTGKGQLVDISMLDCQAQFIENAIVRYLNAGVIPKAIGNRHASITPFQSLPCSDGYIMIAVGNDTLFGKFCDIIERPELKSDERFLTNSLRTQNVKALDEILRTIFPNKTCAEWLRLIGESGIPVGPINTVPQVVEDPCLKARDMIVTLKHSKIGEVKAVNTPIKLSETPGGAEKAAPVLGEHTREVLKEFVGYSDEKIDELYSTGVV